MINNKYIITVFFLMITLGFSGWLLVKTNPDFEITVSSRKNVPDLIMHQVKAEEYDEQGRAIKHFSTKKLSHFTSNTLQATGKQSRITAAPTAKKGLFDLQDKITFHPNATNSKVKIKADSVEIHGNNNLGIYKGHVNFTQDDNHLQADEAMTYNDAAHHLEKLMANAMQGRIHFWTIAQKNKPPLHAYAQHISYLANENKIILSGDALIQQGDTHYSAPHIEYDIKAQHILSDKKQAGNTTIIFKFRGVKS